MSICRDIHVWAEIFEAKFKYRVAWLPIWEAPPSNYNIWWHAGWLLRLGNWVKKISGKFPLEFPFPEKFRGKIREISWFSQNFSWKFPKFYFSGKVTTLAEASPSIWKLTFSENIECNWIQINNYLLQSCPKFLITLSPVFIR